jgi:NAD(P)-dependent dehydrogenase (short-subunit alcohol dehydrogenase family)
LQESVFQDAPNVQNSFGERMPMGRLAESRELADAFIYLLSDSASYVSGHVLTVDGALSISV